MKTVEQILATTPVFLNYWSSQQAVFDDFRGHSWNDDNDEYALKDDSSMKDYRVLFASYGSDSGGYGGEAWVLLEKGGELYEVHGSHCSCYGLEDQFSPERLFLPELKNRIVNGDFGHNCEDKFKEELKEFLGIE